MNFLIRPRAEHDDLQLAQLHASTFASIGETEASAREQLRDPKYTWIVAVSGEEVIGYSAHREQGATFYWSWLGVRPNRRGLGVAKAILQEILNSARAAQVEQIIGDTRNRYKDALVFYVRQDFEIAGTFLAKDNDLMIRIRLRLPR